MYEVDYERIYFYSIVFGRSIELRSGKTCMAVAKPELIRMNVLLSLCDRSTVNIVCEAIMQSREILLFIILYYLYKNTFN